MVQRYQNSSCKHGENDKNIPDGFHEFPLSLNKVAGFLPLPRPGSCITAVGDAAGVDFQNHYVEIMRYSFIYASIGLNPGNIPLGGRFAM